MSKDNVTVKNKIKKILEKIFNLNGIYLKLDLHEILGKYKVKIIDVGARGGFNKRWEQFNDMILLYLFEPDFDEYQNLKLKYKDDDRIRLFNFALSEENGQIDLFIPAWPDSTSVFKHDQNFFEKLNFHEFYKFNKKITVNAKRLDELIKEKIDFIKIDAEGSELSILKSAGNLLDNCIGTELEVSFNAWADKLPLFSDIDNFMKRHDFILTRISDPSYYHYKLPSKNLESYGIIFSSDVLYFKTPYSIIKEILMNQDDSMLLKTISIYLAYGNYEFAYILLQEALSNKIFKSQGDEVYLKIFNTIKKRSGLNSLVPYRKLRNNRFIPKLRSGLDY